MDYETIFHEIEKLVLYNRAADTIPNEEFADTIRGYWAYLEEQIMALSKEEIDSVYEQIKKNTVCKYTGKLKKFFLTVLLYHFEDGQYADALCRELSHRETFSRDEAYFAIRQLLSFDFDKPGIIDIESINDLYDIVINSWRKDLKNAAESLQPGSPDRILVISTHVAGFRHAPTKTLFERMDTLKRELSKEVMAIHSMETLTQEEYFPFYNVADGIVIGDYTGTVNISLPEGTDFTLYQPRNPMPNMAEMLEAIEIVKQFAPGRVLAMGDFSILADIIADRIPTLNMSFGFSGLNKKNNQYVCVFRKLNDKDYAKIDRWGIEKEKYLEGLFTFRFIPQSTHISRKELGLPEDAFIIMAVGNRLGADVTDDYIEMLGTIKDTRWHLALAGANADADYKRMCEKYPFMKEHSTYLGYVSDILAFMECCDLYVNPPRLGGGFSVAEAFFKHIPGVSLNYGDVAAAAGEIFCVESLDEMKANIERYMSDDDYYRTMSERAYERSMVLQDSRQALKSILDEFESRIK